MQEQALAEDDDEPELQLTAETEPVGNDQQA